MRKQSNCRPWTLGWPVTSEEVGRKFHDLIQGDGRTSTGRCRLAARCSSFHETLLLRIFSSVTLRRSLTWEGIRKRWTDRFVGSSLFELCLRFHFSAFTTISMPRDRSPCRDSHACNKIYRQRLVTVYILDKLYLFLKTTIRYFLTHCTSMSRVTRELLSHLNIANTTTV